MSKGHASFHIKSYAGRAVLLSFIRTRKHLCCYDFTGSLAILVVELESGETELNVLLIRSNQAVELDKIKDQTIILPSQGRFLEVMKSLVVPVENLAR